MIKLIKGASVFTPDYIGKKDILLVGGRIGAIDDSIEMEAAYPVEVEVIDGRDRIAVPGFIDSHVHILGGGGEGGYKTRTPEITLTDITTGGITTVIGCLGTDGISRDMVALLSKARGLEEEGITTFIYTGSYRIPVTTITGDVMKDLIVVDKIIGAGEIAISDHRSSQPCIEDVRKLAADVRVGGILSGKAGVINFHLGDGSGGLDMLFDICENTEIPYSQFLPTHMNRNPRLFEEAVRYASAGGYVDFTTSTESATGDDLDLRPCRALKRCLEAGVPVCRITFSSDGQGSLPSFNEKKEFIGLKVGRVSTLYEEVKHAVLDEKIPLDTAVRVITSNPAAILKLKGKGRIEKGFDADLVLLEEKNLEIDTVIALGRIMVRNKQAEVYGTFEK